jgi:hypothetical protein
MKRQQKITLGVMRAAGVSGLLIYCLYYKCSIRQRSAGTNGPMISGCPILSRDSPAALAVRRAPTCGRTLTGISRASPAWAIDEPSPAWAVFVR